jgi:hypothetical protein
MLGSLFCLYRKELKKIVFSKTFILFFSVILIYDYCQHQSFLHDLGERTLYIQLRGNSL